VDIVDTVDNWDLTTKGHSFVKELR
jgi:hypothetical protein